MVHITARLLKIMLVPAQVCLLLVAGMALSACDEAVQDNVDLLQRARESRAEGDLRAATVDLKTLLQEAPENAAARLLLGEIYIAIGNGADAEKELVIAQKHGAPRLETVKAMGNAWLLQRKIDRILDEMRDDVDAPAGLRSVILTLRGKALEATGKLDEAETSFLEASQQYIRDIEQERPHLKLTEPAESVDAIVGLAQVAMRNSNVEKAEALVAKLETLDPENPDVSFLRGNIAYDRRQYGEAEKAFQAAYDARPINAVFLMHLGRSQIAAKKYDQAIVNLDKILESFPEHGYANFLRALASYHSGDYQTAKRFTEAVFKVSKGHVPSYLIAGASSYALGQLEQANKLLSFYVDKAPEDEDARQLLGMTQIRLGRTEQAAVTLRPLESKAGEDYRLLKLIGTAAMSGGDFKSGRHFFEKAVALAPNDADARAAAGIALIALGEDESGLQQLEAALEENPGLKSAEDNLIRAYFKARRFDKVIEYARKVQDKAPDSARGYTLEGLAHLALGDGGTARAMFEKAVETDPDDPIAASNLASYLYKANDTEAARDLLKKSLEANPDHLPTLLQLAKMEDAAGDTEAATRLLERAVEKHPESTSALITLARSYIAGGRVSKSVGIAAKAAKLAPDSPSALEVLGQSQLASGRPADALITFSRLAELQPDSKAAHQLVIRAASAAGNAERMKQALDNVLRVDPTDSNAKMGRARMALADGDIELGERLVAELKSVDPASPVVIELDANLALQQKRVDDAIVAYAKLRDMLGTTRDVLRLAEVQWAAGRNDDAISTLTTWLAEHPEDQVARFKLGQFYQQENRLEEARDAYEIFVKARPDQLQPVNNLAWVLLLLEDYDKAKEYGEKALKLVPNDPVAMDTLGAILLKTGENERALTLLKGAFARLPADPNVGTHLAQALVANDQAPQAREILKAVLTDHDRFLLRSDAEALLAMIEK